jgi:DNA-binding MarR family transcriptional regulator
MLGNVDSSESPNNPLIQNITDLDRRLVRRLRKASNEAWLDIDMPLPVLRALLAVERGWRMTPSEIADYLGVSRSTCSAMLDRLETDGLVGRAINPADRRQFFIDVTPAGRQVAERIDGHRRERLLEALQHLDRRDLETLATGLAALESALIALEAPSPEPAPIGRTR